MLHDQIDDRNGWLRLSHVSKIKKKRDKMEIMRNVNDNKTRMNIVHLPHLKAKNVPEVQWA